MEIRDLSYFRTVVEAGGVIKAAAILHMTPGALSKALQRFEVQVGQDLLRRSGRQLVLTDAGRLLYQKSHRVIDEHRRLIRELDDSGTAQPSALRIATFEVFSTYCLGALVRTLDDVELQVLDVGAAAISPSVATREVDIGITYVPMSDPSLSFRKIASIEFGIYGRRGAFGKTPHSELPFAIPTTRMQLASGELLAIDCWPQHRVPRRVKYRLTMLETALALVRQGACVVFIPLFLAGLHNRSAKRSQQLTRRDPPAALKRVRRNVQLVTRKDAAPGRYDRVAHGLSAAIELGRRSEGLER